MNSNLKIRGILSGRKLLAIIFAMSFLSAYAQPCPGVPSFTINLTGQPAGVWTSSNVSRNGQCCGLPNNQQCIHFLLTLDPNTAGIQIDMIGADPAGSLTYSFTCGGTSYPGGSIKCVAGVGPHDIMFCKPGNNPNVYKITSIAKPTFPPDTSIRLGCKIKMNTLGIVNNTTTWTATNSSNGNAPGLLATINGYLDSLNVARPTYSPGPTAPFWVEYQVCGFPQASGCGFSLTVCDVVRIYNYPALSATVTPNPASFCGINPGSGVTLTTNVSGGQAPYTYSWSVNPSTVAIGTGSTYFAQSTNLYNVKVVDKFYNPATCAAYTTQMSVFQGSVPVVIAGPSKKVCASNPLATVNSTVLFANPSWSTSGTGTFIAGNNFTTTSYMPSFTDIQNGSVTLYIGSTGAGGGCANSIDSLKIYYSSSPTVAISSGSLSCFNSTIAITSTVNGGTSPLTYTWNTGANTSSIIGGPNYYSLFVSDSLGCGGSSSYSLTSPTPMALLFSVTNVSINGGNDGSATVTPSGGTPAYTVNWSNGGTGLSINTLTYGVYTATVTDANGCNIAGSTIVNEPQCLGFTAISAGTPVSCYSGNNGVASVTVSGGTPAYTYTWNSFPVQNTPIAVNLQSGVYSVIVKDQNNCYQTSNVVITQPTVITNVMTQTNVSYYQGNDGAAAANPSGGTSPFSYLWNFGPTTQMISGLTAGIYSVTITDNKGCTKSDAVNILQPPCANLVLNVVPSNVTCFGGNNGSAIAIVTGAQGSYSINWSNGATGPSSGSLIAGNYSVTVITGTCSTFKNFSILQPAALSVGLLPTNVRCNGQQNGTIDLTLSGGTIPYTYQWSNGSSSEDLVNLSPGSYSVQIFDSHGCSVIAAAVITQPSALTATFVTQSVTCIYGNNGAINALPNGGVLPYTYTWSNGANTSSISGLTAGGYTFTVTDANFCSSSIMYVSLLQPDSVKAYSVNIACSVPGSSLTQVAITPTGGISGTYSISFNNGITYLGAGITTSMLTNGQTYSVMIQDANSCISLVPKIITIPNEVKIDSVKFLKCYGPGTSTALVTVYPSGGDNGPYSVSVNNGGSYSPAGTYTFNLNVGTTYSVIVRDGRNCISATTVITLPTILSATVAATSNYNGSNVSCNSYSNGTASVTVSGGGGVYTYSWSTTPTQTLANATSLSAIVYTVTVNDNYNCSVTRTVVLTQPAPLTATAIATSNFNGMNVSCNGYANGTASVGVNGGTLPYNYLWNTIPSQTTAFSSSLSAGIYSVSITDINGCNIVTTVSLTQPPAIGATAVAVSNYNGQNISCNGLANGSASVNVVGGTGSYTYTWSAIPVQTNVLATGLSAGVYSVLITDVNGCTTTKTVNLTEPAPISTTAQITSNYNGQNISCFGSTDGSASVTVGGGTSPYTYTWTSIPPQFTNTAINLCAGVYYINITDVNGCNAIDSVKLTQPNPINASITSLSNYNGFNVACFGYTNGAIDISMNGGTGAYTYSWSNGANTQDLNNIGAGNYTLNVNDINSCATSISVSITQPAKLVLTMDSLKTYNGFNTRCFGSTDGGIFISVNGGVSTYTYVWSNGNSAQDLTGLMAGTYSVIVIDRNGCTVTRDTLLTQPPAVTFSMTSIKPLCFGNSNGSIDITTNGGVSPITYKWSNGKITEDNSNISAGSYTVVYTDKNQCKDSAAILLTQPDPLSTMKTITGLKCHGDTLGNIELTVEGGTAPFTYSWTIGKNTKDLSNVKAGTYLVMISDANGCTLQDTTKLVQPDSLYIQLSSPLLSNGHNISFNNGSDGAINLNVNGGVTPYTYLWSNSVPAKDQTNLIAGTYYVTVVDDNGCKVKGEIKLTEPLILEMPSGFSPNMDGKNDYFVVHGIEAYPDNKLTIFNRWGNVVYTKSGYNNEWRGVGNSGMDLPDATYFVILEVDGGKIVLKGYVELRR